MGRLTSRGLTLLETLVSLVVVSVTIFSSLYLMQEMMAQTRITQSDLDYAIIRNQILASVMDDRILVPTVQGALNPNLACFMNQDQVALTSRNCFGKSGILSTYDIKGNLEYDFSQATAGFGPDGGVCNIYNPSPGVPDPRCPLKLNLNWQSVCEAADPECVNPPIQITGTFEFNGGPAQRSPMLKIFNFNIIRNVSYCPVQSNPVSLQVVPAQPNVTLSPVGIPTRVVSLDAGKVLSTGSAQFTQRIVPCREILIYFQDDMNSPPVIPLTFADAENRSRICLVDEETGTCVFEIIRSRIAGTNSITLNYKAVTQFTTPGTMLISSGSVFSIHIKRNLVQVQLDDKTFYTFSQKLNFPFRARFTPAGKDYSPSGFSNISTSFADL